MLLDPVLVLDETQAHVPEQGELVRCEAVEERGHGALRRLAEGVQPLLARRRDPGANRSAVVLVLDPLRKSVVRQGVDQTGDVPGAHPARAGEFADAQALVGSCAQAHENVERSRAETASARAVPAQAVDRL